MMVQQRVDIKTYAITAAVSGVQAPLTVMTNHLMLGCETSESSTGQNVHEDGGKPSRGESSWGQNVSVVKQVGKMSRHFFLWVN